MLNKNKRRGDPCETFDADGGTVDRPESDASFSLILDLVTIGPGFALTSDKSGCDQVFKNACLLRRVHLFAGSSLYSRGGFWKGGRVIWTRTVQHSFEGLQGRQICVSMTE